MLLSLQTDPLCKKGYNNLTVIATRVIIDIISFRESYKKDSETSVSEENTPKRKKEKKRKREKTSKLKKDKAKNVQSGESKTDFKGEVFYDSSKDENINEPEE